MHYLMNCHYCHNLCRNNVSSWICNICPAEFFSGHINLYTYIDGKKYTFQMRHEHTDSPARIICPRPNVNKDFGNVIGATSHYVDSHIINLPKIPDNINPTNVNEKIKLYLLFS